MIRALIAARRGGVGVLVACAMPVLIGMAAFAVDLGSVTLETRRLQGIADAAAINAAGDPTQAAMRAQAMVDAAGWSRAIGVAVERGTYARDAGVDPASRFTADASGDAVRVTLDAVSPSYFMQLFGRTGTPIRRRATAMREHLASFSIGSRLAAVQGGIVNGYLSSLTGSSVSLSAMDYQALAGADVDLFRGLDALRTRMSLSGASFDRVLAGSVDSQVALLAMADALPDAAAATAMRALAGQAGHRTVTLASLFDLGSYAQQASGPGAMIRLNALSLASAVLQTAYPQRQVSFDVAAGLPGIASTRISLAVGERANQSPWLTVTASGEPVIRTAQARLYAETQLIDAPLPGLTGLARVRVPLFVELASAEARLAGITCPSVAGRAVDIDARPSPGKAALADVDASRLADFTQAVPLSPARMLTLPFLTVDGSATVDLGAAEPWQTLHFDAAAIDAGTAQTVSSTRLTGGIAASLAQQANIRATLIGFLPIPTGPIAGVVGQQLALAAPALDTLLDATTGAMGVRLGQADVRVTGMRCGVAALVA